MQQCIRKETIIRTSSEVMGQAQTLVKNLSHEVSGRTAKSSKKHRFGVSPFSIASYVACFAFVIALVALGYQPPKRSESAAVPADKKQASVLASGTVDQAMATSIAVGIAERSNLPVASNIAERSQSLAAESMLTKTDSNIVAKPTIIQPTADNRTIQSYTTKSGDTAPSVAQQYGISAATLKWANSLTSDALEPGKTLTIPPVDGVLYTAKAGDTVDSIASRFGADKQRLIAYNDLELSGVVVGKQLIIPGGSQPAATTTSRTTTGYGSYSGGYGSRNDLAASVGNRYAYGNCTWYAYERRMQLGKPVGSFWGNASTWAAYASAAGYGVSSIPGPGDVMQNSGGWGGYGHVAIVEAVNPGVSITISEMNGYRFGGGFNRVGRGDISWSEATSGMYRYIK